VRTFVAIDIGGPLDPGKAERPDAPDHLTIRFLGEVPESWLDRISAAVRSAVAPIPPFDLTLEGVGAFPDPNAPRVVWVGVTEGRETVVRVARAVSEALVGEGIPDEPDDFVPHVTLFRVRSPRDRERAQRLLDGTDAAPPARVVHVTDVQVKGSDLTSLGPIHRTYDAAPLGGSAGVTPSKPRRGRS
jgi:RNA 2',3'-cyclic 3'-phosphodiesterase